MNTHSSTWHCTSNSQPNRSPPSMATWGALWLIRCSFALLRFHPALFSFSNRDESGNVHFLCVACFFFSHSLFHIPRYFIFYKTISHVNNVIFLSAKKNEIVGTDERKNGCTNTGFLESIWAHAIHAREENLFQVSSLCEYIFSVQVIIRQYKSNFVVNNSD